MDTEKTAQPFDPASFEHVPVLLNECLDGLKIDRRALSGRHAGGAGHSRQIALRLNGEQGAGSSRWIRTRCRADGRARLAGLPAPWCRSTSAMPDKLWSSWALKRSTARCWIWACPAISWMTRPGFSYRRCPAGHADEPGG